MPHGLILLVEDNTLAAELTMACLLRGEGATNEVVIARDGVEAIDYLFDPEREASGLPGLVLLDLQMPRMDGFGVLRKMRAAELTRFVPVVMLTSSVRPEDVRMAYSLGANGYLDKMSSDGVGWPEMVQTVARYWLRMNLTPNSLSLVGQENGITR
jgi:two-component system, response regulator